jgi:hypothetical protein
MEPTSQPPELIISSIFPQGGWNALALHLFAISSSIGWSVLAGFVIIIIVVVADNVDDFSSSTSWLLLKNYSPYL